MAVLKVYCQIYIIKGLHTYFISRIRKRNRIGFRRVPLLFSGFPKRFGFSLGILETVWLSGLVSAGAGVACWRWCRVGVCAGVCVCVCVCVCRCRTCMYVCRVYVCVRMPCDCYDLLPCVCYDLVRMYVIMYDMARYVRNTIRFRVVRCGYVRYVALLRTNMCTIWH